ncbi:MAG: helix-turn-helix domain-containing protein [Patescibacteria group bacterium]|jgi:sugar-specific transcriptional regulator TrmB
MAKTVEQLLQEIGLGQKEQAVYSAVVSLGNAAVSPIAQKAQINRSTAYDILESLTHKGLVSRSEEKKKIHYFATGINELEEYILAQETNWRTVSDSFKGLKTELSALLNSSGTKPVMRFFEGKAGIKEVWFDQIRGDHKEILCYSSASKVEQALGEQYLKVYAKQKIRSKIKTKLIVPGEKALKDYFSKYYQHSTKDLFAIKTVPPDKFPFEVDINIYGNKISMISLSKHELTAVIIESPVLARNQRMIFDLLWSLL